MDNKENNPLETEITQEENAIKDETPAVEEAAPVEKEPVVKDAPALEEEVKEETAPAANVAEEESQPAHSFEVNDAGEIVIDNTKSVEPTPAPTLSRTAKLKEPISKKKRIAIMCIAAATIVVLFCAIFFPCFFYFRGKVMVSSADDFAKGENGKYFVLKKSMVVDGNLDLSNLDCSIDLNGHDLTIKGKLTISTETEKTINIGTKDGDEYKAKGVLTVDDLEINAKNADVNLISTTIIKGALNVNAAKTFAVSGVSIVNSSNISANKIVVNEAIAAGNTEIGCTFNASNIDIFGLVDVKNVNFVASQTTLHKSGALQNVKLDEDSTMQVFGHVDSITGGSKVAVLDNATCAKFDSVKLVAIYKAYDKTFDTTNCDKIIYLDKLATPVDLIVVEENSKFNATCARVITKGKPVNYKFTYIASNGKETSSNVSADNFYDISTLLKNENGAASISIKVQAIGDYNFDSLNFDELNDGDCLYLDSDTKTISYVYTLTLSTPTGLNVQNVDDQIILSFNAVEFADYYNIVIDNKTTFKSETNSLDIKDYLKDLGYHSIRITANSNSKELKPSKEAMISYKTVEKIKLPDSVTATCKKVSNTLFETTIKLEETTGIYVIEIAGKTYRISNQTEFKITSETDLTNQNITVKVEGYGFYEDSDLATILIVAE